MDWIYFGLFFIALFVLIGAAEGIRAALKWSPEATRKMVHIITGLLISTTPFIFQSKIPLIVISLIFIVFNFLAVRFGLMKGMHGTERRTYGTVFYPIAFMLLVILCWDHYKLVLIVSMLIMALADALAAIVGETLAHPHEYVLAGEKKSLEGSTTMLLASAIITFLYLVFGGRFYGYEISLTEAFWLAALVGSTAVACEAISFQGSDNLSVPLGSAFILHFMLSHSVEINEWFTLGFVLAMLIAYVSYKVGFLDAGGATVTFLLGVVIFGIGRWRFSLPILTFFILSSLLSKAGREQKKKLKAIFQKSSQRDIGQVLANGGLAGILVLMWNYFPGEHWYLLYLGTLAAVTADTWATEIGIFSRDWPRLILNFKPVPPGTSGGISPLGTSAAFAGALVISLVGWMVWGQHGLELKLFLLIIFAGLLASMFDSLLGATIQAQFQCPQCHKITEKTDHCNGVLTSHFSGWKWVTNDVVNLACALFGMALVWVGIEIL